MNFDWLEDMSNDTTGDLTYVTPPTKSVRLRTNFVVSKVLVLWGKKGACGLPLMWLGGRALSYSTRFGPGGGKACS